MISVNYYDGKMDVGITLNDQEGTGAEVDTLQLEDLFTKFIKAIGFQDMHVEIYPDNLDDEATIPQILDNLVTPPNKAMIN